MFEKVLNTHLQKQRSRGVLKTLLEKIKDLSLKIPNPSLKNQNWSKLIKISGSIVFIVFQVEGYQKILKLRKAWIIFFSKTRTDYPIETMLRSNKWISDRKSDKTFFLKKIKASRVCVALKTIRSLINIKFR